MHKLLRMYCLQLNTIQLYVLSETTELYGTAYYAFQHYPNHYQFLLMCNYLLAHTWHLSAVLLRWKYTETLALN